MTTRARATSRSIPRARHMLYAATYQRRRTVWGFNGSGPGSGLYKSDRRRRDMDKDHEGYAVRRRERCRIRSPTSSRRPAATRSPIYPKDPNIVYALDRACERRRLSFERQRRDVDAHGRHHTAIRGRCISARYASIRTTTSGCGSRASRCSIRRTAARRGASNFSRAPHADTHAIWIDPTDSNHLMTGNDGGINITYDRGKTWDYANTVPIGQFYEVGVDNGRPYKICGGLQDNNAWCGPSHVVQSARHHQRRLVHDRRRRRLLRPARPERYTRSFIPSRRTATCFAETS